MNCDIRHFYHNPSEVQYKDRDALRDLKSYDDIIIIKAADKGSGTVIKDRQLYMNDAYRQLRDPDVYAILDGDQTLQYHR